MYKNIGTGFWGIEGLNGEQWLPINLPKSLERAGEQVTLTIRKLNGDNLFMWGEMVEVV